METVKNILVTGGGAPGAPGILQAIRKHDSSIKLFSCDILEDTAGKLIADEYFTVPAGNSTDYIKILLQKCQEHKIATVLPITTRELVSLAQHKEKFTQYGIAIIVSNADEISIANDKGKLYKKLTNSGIKTPTYSIATTYSEYKTASQIYLDRKETFIIKPCISNGSRGFRIVENNLKESDLLFNHKPNSTYIKPEKLDEILFSESFPPILISEYLPGEEYTVDCLIQEGEIKFIIPRLRGKMNNGISVAGTIEQKEDIISYCKEILTVLQLNGPIGIQVKYSSAGQPLLLEINPRIQGTTVALCGAGVNIAAMAVLPEVATSIKNTNEYPIRWGTKFIKHYSELYY